MVSSWLCLKVDYMINKWLKENTESLAGKTVVLTGSTGGIGVHLCEYLAFLGADLILLDRNQSKASVLKSQLLSKHPNINIILYKVDLEDEASVFSACEKLKNHKLDYFIHNAGAYSIPRHRCKSGFDNVYQINFLSPYYMIKTLMPQLRETGGRVVAVGSIAHNYSKSDKANPDFSGVTAASRAYGNAKRYLMFSLFELFKSENSVTLSVAHPGITFTNITAHYPKLIFALIKHPMKIIFMKPKHAALSVLLGLFKTTPYHTWLGPRIFGIWGSPKLRKLKTCRIEESRQISKTAEKVLSLYVDKALR